MRTETEKLCARPEKKLKQCSPIPGKILRSGNENEKVREVAKRASSVSSSPQYTETKGQKAGFTWSYGLAGRVFDKTHPRGDNLVHPASWCEVTSPSGEWLPQFHTGYTSTKITPSAMT